MLCDGTEPAATATLPDDPSQTDSGALHLDPVRAPLRFPILDARFFRILTYPLRHAATRPRSGPTTSIQIQRPTDACRHAATPLRRPSTCRRAAAPPCRRE